MGSCVSTADGKSSSGGEAQHRPQRRASKAPQPARRLSNADTLDFYAQVMVETGAMSPDEAASVIHDDAVRRKSAASIGLPASDYLAIDLDDTEESCESPTAAARRVAFALPAGAKPVWHPHRPMRRKSAHFPWLRQVQQQLPTDNNSDDSDELPLDESGSDAGLDEVEQPPCACPPPCHEEQPQSVAPATTETATLL